MAESYSFFIFDDPACQVPLLDFDTVADYKTGFEMAGLHNLVEQALSFIEAIKLATPVPVATTDANGAIAPPDFTGYVRRMVEYDANRQMLQSLYRFMEDVDAAYRELSQKR